MQGSSAEGGEAPGIPPLIFAASNRQHYLPACQPQTSRPVGNILITCPHVSGQHKYLNVICKGGVSQAVSTNGNKKK